MSENREKGDEPTVDRRRVLKKAMAGGIVGAAILPERWVRPVVEWVIVPAHAQTSPPPRTTTATPPPPTTTATPTTPPPTTTATPTTPPPTTTATPSDVRLKRGMRCVARLENGIGLYRYRYLWSDVEYVGVLAQEVADVVADAVVRGNDGYLRVRYEQLGLSLMTWEHWLAATHERRSSIEAPSLAATSSDTSTRCTI